MRVVIVVPPRDFSDETLADIMLVLRKWNVETVLSSYTKSNCVGLHGAVYTPSINTARLNPVEYDALLLVDGPGIESYKLADFRPMIDLVKLFIKNGKIIGAVGNSVKIFIRANGFVPGKVSAQGSIALKNFASTSRYLVTENNVEIYKNLITAKDSMSAIEFANALLEKLHVK